MLLTDWFAQKNVDDTVIFYYNIYYWYESGSFDYWQVCSPTIWKCILQALQADQRAKYKQQNLSSNFLEHKTFYENWMAKILWQKTLLLERGGWMDGWE